jgi:hypothetical protein
MCARNASGSFPSILQQVGQTIVQNGLAPLRGDVIGPLRTVVFIWLVPITADEVKFVQENGWEIFEDFLEKENPDLTDIYRQSIFEKTR